MMVEDVVFFILGLLFGFVLGIFGNMYVVYRQFSRSIAGKRVEWVREATMDFLSKRSSTAELRDTYRYSLGVIIEDLARTGGNGKKDNGRWPSLADSLEDRWGRFNRFVRPVVDDITAYSFLGVFGRGSTRLRQLDCLTELCIKIEDVVMRVDAACEGQAVVDIGIEGLSPHAGVHADDAKLRAVEDGFRELYVVWQRWVKAIGV